MNARLDESRQFFEVLEQELQAWAAALRRAPLRVLRAALSSVAAVLMSTEGAANSRYREGAGCGTVEHGHSEISSSEVLLALI